MVILTPHNLNVILAPPTGDYVVRVSKDGKMGAHTDNHFHILDAFKIRDALLGGEITKIHTWVREDDRYFRICFSVSTKFFGDILFHGPKLPIYLAEEFYDWVTQ